MKAKVRKILPFLTLSVLAAQLAGCSSYSSPFSNPFSNPFSRKPTGPPPEPNVLPTNYRANLLSFLEKEFVDPTGVRDAYISEPRLVPFGNESRYVVCVRYNAKTGLGDYTGIKDYAAIYFHGDLNQLLPASPEQCAGANFQRWPELEHLKRPGT